MTAVAATTVLQYCCNLAQQQQFLAMLLHHYPIATIHCALSSLYCHCLASLHFLHQPFANGHWLVIAVVTTTTTAFSAQLSF